MQASQSKFTYFVSIFITPLLSVAKLGGFWPIIAEGYYYYKRGYTARSKKSLVWAFLRASTIVVVLVFYFSRLFYKVYK